jgi:YYY domain-containing protein
LPSPITTPPAPWSAAAQTASARVYSWLGRRDPTLWLLIAIAVVSLAPRLYGLNWDADNHLHPDERQIVFVSMCLTLPGTPRAAPPTCPAAFTGPGWLLSPSSPLNPHFFAYGSLPLYLLAIVVHGLAWLSHTSGLFPAPGRGAWDDFNHFTLIGRALSALFDAGSVLLAGLIARRLAGRKTALLAAAFVATIAFDVQVAHFYAVDTLMLFFVLLTLLGCVMLVQAPPRQRKATPAADDGESAPEPEPRAGIWRPWGIGLFVGAAFGLALGSKISALPLLVPIGVALVLRWRRRGFDEALLAVLGVAAAATLAFCLTNPYALLDLSEFQSQVQVQNALSRGQLDYPYVRQFADTTPFVYQIQQLLLYDMGLPLGLLGLAGFGWAVSRVWRRLDDDWLLLVAWIAVYFTVVGSAYMKFSRYMLPVFVPLAICGAAMLGALAAWGTRRLTATSETGDGSTRQQRSAHIFASRPALAATRLWGTAWWRVGCIALSATILAASTFATLALVNIYSTPNTRVQASEWIYDHIPAGAAITNEIWDDPLPILVPPASTSADGSPLTRGGHVIAPYQYNPIGLDLYADDTSDKAATLSGQLASASVVVISSQRLLRSIPKLPDRYPMTTRYYQLLFAGKLGFTLAAHVENQPHLLGITLNDSGADESFSVYDHPPVWIFVRSGAGLTKQQILTELTSGVSLPATAATRSGAQKSLLLPPTVSTADAQAQPLGVQFPANSLPNTVPLVWWLLIVELLGLGSFPLTYFVFRGLYDRGWGLSKVLGMLLLAWLTWLPASLHSLPFDHWVVVAAFVAIVAAGAAVGWRWRDELLAFVRARWRVLAIGEAAFLVAFLFFTWVRALDPDLWHIYRGGEKPMELAFLDAILRSRYLPPLDPWFSGGYINYYYYGQYIFAALIKLTGIAPTTAFNLAIPLLFGVTISGAYSVVCGLTRRWWAGLAAGFGLAVAGNLDGLGQLIGQWRAVVAGFAPQQFDYWASSRVIPYTINEFPYWSFLYADLHAHLIDLPIVVFIIAACASLLASARADGRQWRFAMPALAAVALALGAAWCTSTWDVPTFGLLFAVVLALRLLPFGEPERWARLRDLVHWSTIRGYAAALVLTLGATYLLYFPFHASFQNFVSGTGPVTTPTDPALFATIFGLWLFLLVSFFVVELRDRFEGRIILRTPQSDEHRSRRLWLFVGICGLVLLCAFLAGTKVLLILLLAAGVVLALDSRHSPTKLMTYALLLLGLAVALGVEFIYVRDFLDNSQWERMNTVFKFYYQVWTLFALGGALVFTQLIRRMWDGGGTDDTRAERIADDRAVVVAESPDGGGEPWAMATWELPGSDTGLLRGAWLIALTLLVLGSCVFLVEGTQVRVQDPAGWAVVQPPPGGIQPRGLSLDGMAYMRGWYPGDYAAITWLNQHVGGDPTIVEASNGNYQWYGRVSIYTGLPDVLGWGSREYEQRYGEEVFPRQEDVQHFWGGEDPNAALAFLRQYNVKYIYVGDLERTCYVTQGDGQCVPMSAAAVAKFATLQSSGGIQQVYDQAGVVIYEVTG